MSDTTGIQTPEQYAAIIATQSTELMAASGWTEQPTTREIPMTLGEFNDAKTGTVESAEAYTTEQGGFTAEQYTVFTELASVVEAQLYDGRPNHETVARQTAHRLASLLAEDTLTNAMAAEYVRVRTSLVWFSTQTGEIVQPEIMGQWLRDEGDAFHSPHTYVKRDAVTVVELNMLGHTVTTFRLRADGDLV